MLEHRYIIISSHTQEVSQMANDCTKYHFLRYTCETIFNYIDCFQKRSSSKLMSWKTLFLKEFREKKLEVNKMKQWWYSEYNVLSSNHHLMVYSLHLNCVKDIYTCIWKTITFTWKRQNPYRISTQSTLCTNDKSE